MLRKIQFRPKSIYYTSLMLIIIVFGGSYVNATSVFAQSETEPIVVIDPPYYPEVTPIEPIACADMIPRDMLAASLLGMSWDALRTQLASGITIAAMAEERGIDPETIVAAIVESETRFYLGEAAAGCIDQAWTDATVATLPEDVHRFVYGPEHATPVPTATPIITVEPIVTVTVPPATPTTSPDLPSAPTETVDWLGVIAQLLEMDSNELFLEMIDALLHGDSIADMALSHGVSAQQIISAIVTAERVVINAQIADGTISQREGRIHLKVVRQVIRELLTLSVQDIVEQNANDEASTQSAVDYIFASGREERIQAMVTEELQQPVQIFLPVVVK